MNAKYGLNLTGAPKVNDPDFVYQLVFDPARGARVPKARFAYLFPSADSALVSVRLKAGLSDDERSRAVALVRAAVAMDEWRLDGGGRYVVTGVPVLAGDITDVLAASTLRLLLVAVAVMALVLALLFRARPRLLPLGLALCAAAIVFGGLAALGLPLTMASIAVLPVLMGLAVDYCVQYQARAALGGLAGHGGAGDVRGVPRSCCCRRCRWCAGSARCWSWAWRVALVIALTAGTAALTLGGAPPGSDGALARSLRGAGDLVDARPRSRRPARPHASVGSTTTGGETRRSSAPLAARPRSPLARHPQRVLVVAAALAICGWALDARIGIVSDLPRLVPQDLAAVRDLDALQRDTGVAGEVDVLVEGKDLTDPKVIAWMRDYQNDILIRHGYDPAEGLRRRPSCVPALSLPDLFRTPELSATREQVRALLDTVPAYFSQAAITPDRRTAVLAFGIRLQSLEAPARGDREHARAAEPAGRRARDRRRAARAGGRRQPRAQRPAAAAAVRARGAGRRRAGAVRRLPLVDAGLGAAGPDRARHGLVGARAVAARRAAEPDVGGAERARDRDLDRVLGAAVARATATSARTVIPRARRSSAPTPPRAPPCSPPASPRSRASPS